MLNKALLPLLYLFRFFNKKIDWKGAENWWDGSSPESKPCSPIFPRASTQALSSLHIFNPSSLLHHSVSFILFVLPQEESLFSLFTFTHTSNHSPSTHFFCTQLGNDTSLSLSLSLSKKDYMFLLVEYLFNYIIRGVSCVILLILNNFKIYIQLFFMNRLPRDWRERWKASFLWSWWMKIWEPRTYSKFSMVHLYTWYAILRSNDLKKISV